MNSGQHINTCKKKLYILSTVEKVRRWTYGMMFSPPAYVSLSLIHPLLCDVCHLRTGSVWDCEFLEGVTRHCPTSSHLTRVDLHGSVITSVELPVAVFPASSKRKKRSLNGMEAHTTITRSVAQRQVSLRITLCLLTSPSVNASHRFARVTLRLLFFICLFFFKAVLIQSWKFRFGGFEWNLSVCLLICRRKTSEKEPFLLLL